VVLGSDPGTEARDLVRALARPGVPLVIGVDQIERLGGGPHRSRGSFWVPTRPGDQLEWSGAGGQLSIGCYSPWGRRTPVTRLLVTGIGTPPDDLAAAFEDVLLTPAEAILDHRSWDVHEDGLEPWLGDIRDVA
jgi:hypothetical protein